MSYITFLDLLGTKAVGSFSNKLYFKNIKTFHDAIKNLYENTYKSQKIKTSVFSDCAYIECDNLEILLSFVKDLRYTLFLDEVFFNAAITTGTLNMSPLCKEDVGLSILGFSSADIVRVYSMQSEFSGVGIYIDPSLLANNTKIQNNVVISAYCILDGPELVYRNFKSYCDVKYDAISKTLIKYLLMNYIKTTTLNKRAGRYYLSAIFTCINQLSFNELTQKFLNTFLAKEDTIQNNAIFGDLLPIYLMLINRLYDSYCQINPQDEIDEINSELKEFLDKIVKVSPLKMGFDNFGSYSDKLISKKNKYYFTDYLAKTIINRFQE